MVFTTSHLLLHNVPCQPLAWASMLMTKVCQFPSLVHFCLALHLLQNLFLCLSYSPRNFTIFFSMSTFQMLPYFSIPQCYTMVTEHNASKYSYRSGMYYIAAGSYLSHLYESLAQICLYSLESCPSFDFRNNSNTCMLLHHYP